ncbi:CRISPR-associated endoribonuclease Cas6 [Desulfallas sp. Bu1-1]|uniref:CRISPR-associated endoribonuclease Cas6 n=1 Tax=Desulfallas sp. Bu1-1 TaxID=2787620 RepID=UPI0018A126C2|nr:CRISPR-associated endoribonuclease Cas6 [Desulfallas sp. Bu1-1]MBF7082172.1 CRISPR-associated endoribonuclease Cas6 [Desulfallas sp. Bu1-1]
MYLVFKPVSENFPVPINYNYLVQSAIYSSLGNELAEQLHDEGYMVGKRKLKLFAFSRLMGRYELDRERKTINFPDGFKLVISSPDHRFLESLAQNLLHSGLLRLGLSIFELQGIETLDYQVDSDHIKVRTISPIVVYSTLLKPEGGKYTCYYQPGEREFANLLAKNLRKKYEAYYNQKAPEGEVSLKPLSRPRLHVTSYKNTVIKGYSCRLIINGPKKLLKIGVDAGLGAKCSQGYGCIEIFKTMKGITDFSKYCDY